MVSSDDSNGRARGEVSGVHWSSTPSARERAAAQRAVNALLDLLAPEQMQTRREKKLERIERHRSPFACVLQGPTAAISLNWFPDATVDKGLGELHVLSWEGVVSRRGSPAARSGARLISELVLRPIFVGTEECVWEDAQGVRSATAALAIQCEKRLEEQLAP